MLHHGSPVQPVVFLLVLNMSLLAAAITSVQLAPVGSACPADFEKIETWPECRAALDFLAYKESGDQYLGTENVAGWPSGCYKCANVVDCEDGVWFNEHPVGSSVAGTQLVCVHTQEGFATGSALFIGDSDTDYWATSPSPTGVQEYAFANSYNVAVAGYTCEDVLGEIDALLQVFQPAVVAITCGENDLTGENDSPDGGASPATTFDRFKQIVTKVTAANARVFITGTKPEPCCGQMYAVYREYDALVKGLATELANNASPGAPPLVQIDSDNGFLDIGNPDTLYDSDRLHLSAAGYDLWTRWLRLAFADTAGCVVWRSDQCAQTASSSQATTASPTPSSTPSAAPSAADISAFGSAPFARWTLWAAAAAAVIYSLGF